MRRLGEAWPLARRLLARSFGFVAAVWLGVRGHWIKRRGPQRHPTEAVQALRRQYALGAIGREAFERRLGLKRRRR